MTPPKKLDPDWSLQYMTACRTGPRDSPVCQNIDFSRENRGHEAQGVSLSLRREELRAVRQSPSAPCPGRSCRERRLGHHGELSSRSVLEFPDDTRSK
ncbi:hypothetical protein H8959_013184 [Pygathrix nigripes]